MLWLPWADKYRVASNTNVVVIVIAVVVVVAMVAVVGVGVAEETPLYLLYQLTQFPCVVVIVVARPLPWWLDPRTLPWWLDPRIVTTSITGLRTHDL